MWDKVSRGAAQCCHQLWQAGFRAWPVGGCVRDLLLGRVPGDYDVTTDARPEQVLDLFDHTVPTGVKHGTVTVLMGEEPVEVTTLRGETGYSDGRHPDGVHFGVTLEEDLARRDFTINAMALDESGRVVDLFGGQADLQAGLVRCVGEPHRRFEEDTLRMLRGVRFCAQLGFQLEENTRKAMEDCACKVKALAVERVRVEVEKTLLSPGPEGLEELFGLGLLSPWYQGAAPRLEGLAEMACERLDRWAVLCARLERGEEFLARLKPDGRLYRACVAGLALYRVGLPTDERGWRHALAQYGTEGCRGAACMAGAGQWLAQLDRVLAQEPCVSVAQLALSGGDLVALGLTGPEVGLAQKRLLERVLDDPGLNDRDTLKLLVGEM